ncbi:MAG: beta-ketoacyl synthase N-terminal-like domain-containing protein [Pseudomonadota bacterium]
MRSATLAQVVVAEADEVGGKYSFGSILAERASQDPDRLAYTFLPNGEEDGPQLTYHALHSRAAEIGLGLSAVAAPGERCILAFPAGLSFIEALFGVFNSGLIAVPAEFPVRRAAVDRFQAIADDCSPSIVLTSREGLAILRDRPGIAGACPEARWFATEDFLGHDRSLAPSAVTPQEIAMLQYTSGSTERPKGVILSHRNLIANSTCIQQSGGQNGSSTYVSWLPQFHDMGLVDAILQPLFANCPAYLMPASAFAQRPIRWLRAICKYRGTHTGAPNFAYDLCVTQTTESDRVGLDLRSWRGCAYNAAEPIRRETLTAFAETFGPYGFAPEILGTCYGLAEATLVVSTSQRAVPPRCRWLTRQTGKDERNPAKPSDRAASGRWLVSSGRPVATAQVIIVDPTTGILRDAGDEGEIWVSGPSVGKGYWGRAEDTRRTFAATLNNGTDAYLRTGDLGFLDEDGELFVTGRIKDLLIVGGRNVHPNDVEATAASAHVALQGQRGAVFAIETDRSERVVLVQEVARAAKNTEMAQEIVAALRAAVSEAHEITVDEIVLVRRGAIPKTTSGKVQRRECKSLFEANGFRNLAPQGAGTPVIDLKHTPTGLSSARDGFDRTSLRRWLQAEIANALDQNEAMIATDVPFSSLGLGSLGVMNIARRLEDRIGQALPVTLLFDAPTIDRVVEAIAASGPSVRVGPRIGGNLPVAVIGMACRFPRADGVDAYWKLLKNGVDAVGECPPHRVAAGQGRSDRPAGYLQSVDGFDAAFFRLSPREASQTDPQQRLLLEVAWHALEHAGLSVPQLRGQRIGVFIGASSGDYAQLRRGSAEASSNRHAATGLSQAILSNRISYLFDFRGPSLTIDTACSSSLAAVHQGVRSLRSGECDLALVGGVNLALDDRLSQSLDAAGMLSADGRCKAFAAGADGYGRGEGCALVVLKRLPDAQAQSDPIAAVVLGSAMSHGGETNGLTAPSPRAQSDVIAEALDDAGCTMGDLAFVEAHGSGTDLGDRIEISALSTVLARDPDATGKLVAGSVKSNIGHLEAAAGIAGLIKAVLAIRNRLVPASLHIGTVNPHLRADPRILFAREATPLEGGAQSIRAGVSAFGFGGNNVHVVLEEAQAPRPEPPAVDRTHHVLALSARRREDLASLAGALSKVLRAPAASVIDIAHSANTGRSGLEERLVASGESAEEIAQRLKCFAEAGRAAGVISGRRPDDTFRPAFLFSGQGATSLAITKDLCDGAPVFRDALQRCDAILRASCGVDVLSILLGKRDPAASLEPAARTHAAIVSLQYALTALWQSWGITPAIVIGHSLGEIAAAVAAGILDLEDGLTLVCERGRLIDTLPQDGVMASVFASERVVRSAMTGMSAPVFIAALNAPEHCTISGSAEGVQNLRKLLGQQGVKTEPLPMMTAFHSPSVDPIVDALEGVADGLRHRPAKQTFVSTMTGTVVSEIGPAHWRHHMRQTVRFSDALSVAMSHGANVFIEIGTGRELLYLASLAEANVPLVASLRPGRASWPVVLKGLGEFYLRGAPVNWAALGDPCSPKKVPLPQYPFQHRSYWFDDTSRPANDTQTAPPRLPGKEASIDMCGSRSAVGGDSLDEIWSGFMMQMAPLSAGERSDLLTEQIEETLRLSLGYDANQVFGPNQTLWDLGVDSLLATQLRLRFEEAFGISLPATLLLDRPTVPALVEHLLPHLANAADGAFEVAAVPRVADRDKGATLPSREIADLTEAEAQRALETTLARLAARERG